LLFAANELIGEPFGSDDEEAHDARPAGLRAVERVVVLRPDAKVEAPLGLDREARDIPGGLGRDRALLLFGRRQRHFARSALEAGLDLGRERPLEAQAVDLVVVFGLDLERRSREGRDERSEPGDAQVNLRDPIRLEVETESKEVVGRDLLDVLEPSGDAAARLGEGASLAGARIDGELDRTVLGLDPRAPKGLVRMAGAHDSRAFGS